MIQWRLICGFSFLGPQDEPSEKSEQKVLEAEQADLFLGSECGLDPAGATQLGTKQPMHWVVIGALGGLCPSPWVGCASIPGASTGQDGGAAGGSRPFPLGDSASEMPSRELCRLVHQGLSTLPGAYPFCP